MPLTYIVIFFIFIYLGLHIFPITYVFFYYCCLKLCCCFPDMCVSFRTTVYFFAPAFISLARAVLTSCLDAAVYKFIRNSSNWYFQIKKYRIQAYACGFTWVEIESIGCYLPDSLPVFFKSHQKHTLKCILFRVN